MCPPSPSAQRDAVSAVPPVHSASDELASPLRGAWAGRSLCDVLRGTAACGAPARGDAGINTVPRARLADAKPGITLLKASEGHHFFSSTGMLCSISAGECMHVLRVRSRAV